MKIVTIFPSFENKGGAEDMAISIAQGLNPNTTPIILYQNPIINGLYQGLDVCFKKFNFSNIRQYHKDGAIFISHHRKSTTLLLLISKLLFWGKLRVIHVAHNTFTTLKLFTLFPKYNIAVSKTVKQNMISYFGLNGNNIEVIYNGIKDQFDPKHTILGLDENKINILFLGRINPVKRQVEFVKRTKGRLNKNIKIYFGGEGIDSEKLRVIINKDRQYEMLGLIETYKELYKYDYVCLFSENEGLPLSLIEGTMFAKPLITNDIAPCLEININNCTGFVNNSWEDIIDCINRLPLRDSVEYKSLSNNSRETFERLFSYDVMIDNYSQFIKSIKSYI